MSVTVQNVQTFATDMLNTLTAEGVFDPNAKVDDMFLFCFWLRLPVSAPGVVDQAKAAAFAQTVRSKMGPNYLVGIGGFFMSVAYYPIPLTSPDDGPVPAPAHPLLP